MKAPRRILMALLSLGMMAAGCSNSIAVPKEFCGVPVESESLSPLLPDEGKLKGWHADMESRPGIFCNISVDRTVILYASVQYYDRPPEPVDWKAVASRNEQAAKRGLAFPGEGIVGSKAAIIVAKCNTPTAYMDVTVDFNGSRVEDSPEGYKKLQRFIEDFVPRETKKYGCTK